MEETKDGFIPQTEVRALIQQISLHAKTIVNSIEDSDKLPVNRAAVAFGASSAIKELADRLMKLSR